MTCWAKAFSAEILNQVQDDNSEFRMTDVERKGNYVPKGYKQIINYELR